MPRAATAIIMITMTTTLTESGLYRLLAWLSPSFPVGAFSYSHGIEAAVEAGSIADRAGFEAWVGSILRHGTGRIDADLFRDATDRAQREQRHTGYAKLMEHSPSGQHEYPLSPGRSSGLEAIQHET